MDWRDINNLFDRAKGDSQHEWLEDDGSESGSGPSDDEGAESQGEEAEDELESEEILHEKERALLEAMKAFKKRQSTAQEAGMTNPNLRLQGKAQSQGSSVASNAKPPKTGAAERGESLYSKTQDDKDAAWIRAHYLKHRQNYKSRQSDATLSCPCCFTVMCYDCQRHETYHTQFRAMFVANCHVAKDSVLRGEGSTEVFTPVACDHCGTEVGVIDEEEVYHFFSVLAGEPI